MHEEISRLGDMLSVPRSAYDERVEWRTQSCREWAAQNGHVDLLDHLLVREDDEAASLGLPAPTLDASLFEAASRGGQLGVLCYLERVAGRPTIWDHMTYTLAACLGAIHGSRIDVLMWIDNQKDLSADYDVLKELFVTARMLGRLEVMQWLYLHKCSPELRAILTHGLAAQAASVGHLEVLRWAFPICCPAEYLPMQPGAIVADMAAQHGHLHILEWIFSEVPWLDTSPLLYCTAVHFNQITVLDWLARRGVPMPPPFSRIDLCSAAAKKGHLEALKWLRSREPPVPWDERVCRLALSQGHLDVLRWARTQRPRCPWDEKTRAKALERPGLAELDD